MPVRPLPSPLRRMACVMAICAGLSAGTGPVMAAPPGTGPAIAAQASSSEVEFHGLAMAFVRFWDDTKHLPMSQRLARFKSDVASRFPGFYDAERFGSRVTQAQIDERIGEQMLAFPEIREAFVAKALKLEQQLGAHQQAFRQAFPKADFRGMKVYALHSMGEMDGGTRSFAGPRTLILGVDGMVRYHGESNDESAFFHHELFHIIHQADLGPCVAVWCALWREGLAVHVSKELNPSANASEMLLDFPKGLLTDVEKVRQASLDDLSRRLDSEDEDVYRNLFQTKSDDQRLPVRRGYVLGWWIARHLGQAHSLQEMAEWDGPTVRRRVGEALATLRAQAAR